MPQRPTARLLALLLAQLLALLLLLLLATPSRSQTQTQEWTLHPDEAGNLVAACTADDASPCDSSSSAVEVPALRVAGPTPGAEPRLSISYDKSARSFSIAASGLADVDVRVAGVSVQGLAAENAALRAMQAKLQCALVAAGTEGVDSAIRLVTRGARRWRHFTINTKDYLFVANQYYAGTFFQNSTLYKLSSQGTFEAVQNISTIGATDAVHFNIAGADYLAVTNSRNDTSGSFLQDSVIYKWSGQAFVAFQRIPTMGALDIEYFSIGSGLAAQHFLAVANRVNAGVYEQFSVIYVWNGVDFEPFQYLATRGAYDIEHFVMRDGQHYLAVAFLYTTDTYVLESEVHKWDGSHFVSFQNITTTGATSFAHFRVGETDFLAVASYRNYTSQVGAAPFVQASVVYAFNGSAFVPFQTLVTTGGIQFEAFQISGETYLAVANHRNGNDYIHDSMIYRFDEPQQALVPFQSIRTNGALGWTHFQVGAKQHFLAVALYYNNSDITGPTLPRQESLIYRWNSRCFV